VGLQRVRCFRIKPAGTRAAGSASFDVVIEFRGLAQTQRNVVPETSFRTSMMMLALPLTTLTRFGQFQLGCSSEIVVPFRPREKPDQAS
jgi:hypothetical protein